MNIYTKYKDYPGILVLDAKGDNEITYTTLLHDMVNYHKEIIAVTNFVLKEGNLDVIGIQEDNQYKIYNFINIQEFLLFRKKYEFPLVCDVILMTERDCIKGVNLDRLNKDFESVLEHCRRNNDRIFF